MKLWSNDFEDSAEIPAKCAFAKPHRQTHIELSDNKNPHLAWSDLPSGTKSLVLICHDPDVPSRPDDVNTEGVTVPASLPRVDFYHWVVIDIAPGTGSIGYGELSAGITPKGKAGPAALHGMRQGINNYTDWFAADPDMAGKYFGYDGPCPPWNDEIVHHYHFTLYATDLAKCPVEGEFTAPDVLKAIDGHILGRAALVGTYTLRS